MEKLTEWTAMDVKRRRASGRPFEMARWAHRARWTHVQWRALFPLFDSCRYICAQPAQWIWARAGAPPCPRCENEWMMLFGPIDLTLLIAYLFANALVRWINATIEK